MRRKRMISEGERLGWGRLLMGEPVIGAATLRRMKRALVKEGVGVEEFWRQPREWGRQWGWEEKKLAVVAWVAREWPAEKLAEYLRGREFGVTVVEDETYPGLLKYIPDFAPALFYQGNLEVLARPTVAIVGSRAVTDYGRRVIGEILNERGRGLTIVSGLMRGVDMLGHQRALAVGAGTAAILGYGLELTWPREVRELRGQILAAGGVLLSEYAPWSAPLAMRFPIRNRLVAGASLATVVVEATEKSGSLITANLALDYGREVLTVPGSIFSEQSRGCLALLRQGALLVTSSEELIEAVVKVRVGVVPEGYWEKMGGLGAVREAAELVEVGERKIKEFVDPLQNRVYQLLLQGEGMTEELAGKLNEGVVAVISALSLLELAGEVRAREDGRWELTN